MSLRDMMWAEALIVLARSSPGHGSVFQPTMGGWEPAIDVLETETALVVVVALPGVLRSEIEVVLGGGHLVVRGNRRWMPLQQPSRVHRMELPHGRFERHLRLPLGAFRLVGDTHVDGCLVLTLERLG